MMDDSGAFSSPFDSNLMGEIVPGLWIGSLWSVKELKKTPPNSSHIQWTIVSVLQSPKLLLYAKMAIKDTQHAHSDLIIVSEEWTLADQSQAALLSSRLSEILSLIDDAVLQAGKDDENDRRHCCLVHCAFGVSRSAAVCAAWLISRRGCTLSQAMEKIRTARPDASPNIGFIAGLRALEQCNGNVQEAILRMKKK
jgi:hypothetical protein